MSAAKEEVTALLAKYNDALNASSTDAAIPPLRGRCRVRGSIQSIWRKREHDEAKHSRRKDCRPHPNAHRTD